MDAQKNNHSLFISAPLAIVLVVIGFVAGWYGQASYDRSYNTLPNNYKLLQDGGKYTFINPLLGFELPEAESKPFVQLESKINSYIENQKEAQTVSDVGVYFRELNTGRWVGVNEDEQFAPASMLKVPIMITYFKQAESDPTLLDKDITYTGTVDLNAKEYFRTSTATPQYGKKYKVSLLVDRMIVNSGNNSADMLMKNINPEIPKQVFDSLGIPEHGPNVIDYMSPKTFSFTFRTLYNATYLNRLYSEQALEILSRSAFKQGLVGLLPFDIKVAHKFGERTVELPNGSVAYRELHDCGIVYITNNPYFLCVMTKGTDFDKLANFIQGLSKLVYDDVVSNIDIK